MYLSVDELIELERARLTLRGRGIGVDRGRLVREAIAILLADLESGVDASVIARRLRGGAIAADGSFPVTGATMPNGVTPVTGAIAADGSFPVTGATTPNGVTPVTGAGLVGGLGTVAGAGPVTGAGPVAGAGPAVGLPAEAQ